MIEANFENFISLVVGVRFYSYVERIYLLRGLQATVVSSCLELLEEKLGHEVTSDRRTSDMKKRLMNNNYKKCNHGILDN